MTDTPKILESWKYAEIASAFMNKLEKLTNDFEEAIDESDKNVLPGFITRANDLIDEYHATAEDLAQYGTGIKKKQFLEDHEDDIDYLKDQIGQANEKLGKAFG